MSNRGELGGGQRTVRGQPFADALVAVLEHGLADPDPGQTVAAHPQVAPGLAEHEALPLYARNPSLVVREGLRLPAGVAVQAEGPRDLVVFQDGLGGGVLQHQGGDRHGPGGGLEEAPQACVGGLPVQLVRGQDTHQRPGGFQLLRVHGVAQVGEGGPQAPGCRDALGPGPRHQGFRGLLETALGEPAGLGTEQLSDLRQGGEEDPVALERGAVDEADAVGHQADPPGAADRQHRAAVRLAVQVAGGHRHVVAVVQDDGVRHAGVLDLQVAQLEGGEPAGEDRLVRAGDPGAVVQPWIETWRLWPRLPTISRPPASLCSPGSRQRQTSLSWRASSAFSMLSNCPSLPTVTSQPPPWSILHSSVIASWTVRTFASSSGGQSLGS